MAEPKKYVVTGKYVTVKTMTTEGIRVIGLYTGAPVPGDVPPDDLAHLLSIGLVHEEGWVPPTPGELSAADRASYADAVLRSAESELEKARKAVADAKTARDAAAGAAADAEAAKEKAAAPDPGPGEAGQAKAEADAAAAKAPPPARSPAAGRKAG